MSTTDHTPAAPPALPRSSSLRRNLIGLAAVIALAAGFAFATGQQGRHEVTVVTPDPVASAASAVTWSYYRPGFREQLAGYGCEQLGTAYGAAEIVARTIDSRPIEAYIAALAVAKHCAP